MELVSGISLAERLTAGPLPASEALNNNCGFRPAAAPFTISI